MKKLFTPLIAISIATLGVSTGIVSSKNINFLQKKLNQSPQVFTNGQVSVNAVNISKFSRTLIDIQWIITIPVNQWKILQTTYATVANKISTKYSYLPFLVNYASDQLLAKSKEFSSLMIYSDNLKNAFASNNTLPLLMKNFSNAKEPINDRISAAFMQKQLAESVQNTYLSKINPTVFTTVMQFMFLSSYNIQTHIINNQGWGWRAH